MQSTNEVEPASGDAEWGAQMGNKGGFSWKRLTGISAAKSRISRATGIPFSRSGRNAKIGRMVTGGGCLLVLLAILAVIALLLVGCGAGQSAPTGPAPGQGAAATRVSSFILLK